MDSSLGALRSASFAMLPSASSGSRAYFPVNPSQYVYSQFKYVAGTPANDGSGIALSKLKILNTIIDQLVAMKKASANLIGGGLEFPSGAVAEEEISPMIMHYQREVQATAESLRNVAYRPPMPETGLLFSIKL